MRYLFLLFFYSFTLQALQFEGPFSLNGKQSYKMKGDFDKYSYFEIQLFLKKNQNKQIMLLPMSNGGDARHIYKIQELFDKYPNIEINTSIPGTYCRSACAVAVLKAHTISGPLYFHGFRYIDPITKETTAGVKSKRLKQINLQLRNNLIENGIDKNTANRIINHEIYFVSINFDKNIKEEQLEGSLFSDDLNGMDEIQTAAGK